MLLAGDAGGFTDSNNGEGIVYALLSGDIAAQTIIAHDDPETEKTNIAAGLEVSAWYEKEIENSGLMKLMDRKKLIQTFSSSDACESYVRAQAQHCEIRNPVGH